MRVQTFSRSLGWPANGHPLAFLAITLAISVAASAQVTQFFTWQGDNNNNWQNSANWGQTPGSGDVPDATNHQVRFDDTANRLNVDLNNNDRTVGKITFDLASNVSYLIRSSSQNGIVRNFGDLVSPDAHNVAFDASISYFQDSDGVWTLNTNPAYMVFNCAVGGAFGNSITLDGGVTLGAANTFSGDFLITSGATAVLGNDLSLQNANVWIESGGTLDLLLNGVSPKFMTLRGPGGFNLPVGATLTVGGTVFASPNTYSGVIVSGASSTLTKLGGATWQLSASNMFPGTINIDAGAIRPTLSDTLALATVSINTNNGLTLPAAVDATLGGLAGSGNLNIGATTLTIGANDRNTVYTGIISGTGSVIKTGAGAMTVRAASTYTGPTDVDGGSIVFGNNGALSASTVSVNVDNGLAFVTNGAVGALTGAGNIDLGDDRLTAGGNGESTTYSGRFSSTVDGQFTKTGAGTMTLTGGTSGNRSRIGTLRSAGGLLEVDGAYIDLTYPGNSATRALVANPGDITLLNGAVLTVTANLDDPATAINGDGTLTVTGLNTRFNGTMVTVADGSDGHMTVSDNGTAARSHHLWLGQSNAGDLTVQSGGHFSADRVRVGIEAGSQGTLRVEGVGTTATAGLLDLGGYAAASGGTGNVTVRDGSTMQVATTTKFWTSTSSMTVDGGTFTTDRLINQPGVFPTINVTGSGLTVGGAGGSSVFEGVFGDAAGGPGGLTKIGAGDLTLTNSSTHSGVTRIQGGSVTLAVPGALQFSTVSIETHSGLDITTNSIDAVLGGLAGSGNLNIGPQTILVGLNGADTTYAGVISGAGSLVKIGSGVLTLSGNNAYSGSTNITAGALAIGADNNLGSGSVGLDGGTLITNGSFILNHNINQGNLQSNSATIQTEGAGDIVTLNGGLSGLTSSRLNKTGVGRLRMNQSTSYPGLARVNAGSIVVGHASALHNAGVEVNVDGGLVLDAGGAEVMFARLTGSGDFNNSGHNIRIASNTNDTYSGDIAGAGGLTKLGLGTLTLSGANTFTGDTNTDTGLARRIILGVANALQSSTVNVNGNGLFDINGFDAALGGLAGVGNLDIGSRTVSFGGNDADTTYVGVISGAGALIKQGGGVFTLDGASDVDGGIDVNGGTLGGSGNVAGLTRVNSGGTVAPGASAGVLTVDDITFENGSTLAIELAGNGTDFDQLVVANTATISAGATLDISYIGGFTAAPGDSFVIVDAGSSLSGAFDTVNFPDGQNWTIEYDSLSGTIAVSVAAVTPCFGDLDADGDVDLGDLSGLLAHFGQMGATYNDGDLDGDGMVGLSDLAGLLAVFGAICP